MDKYADRFGRRRASGHPPPWGIEKALHHYPKNHYLAWISEPPDCASRIARVPAFGEYISTLGITEADVCVGDIFKLGNATLQISQGRQPC